MKKKRLIEVCYYNQEEKKYKKVLCDNMDRSCPTPYCTVAESMKNGLINCQLNHKTVAEFNPKDFSWARLSQD